MVEEGTIEWWIMVVYDEDGTVSFRHTYKDGERVED